MKPWYTKLAKCRQKIACFIVFAGIAITPFFVRSAYTARGYKAIGGEYAPLIFSFITAAVIIQALSELESDYLRRTHEKSRCEECEEFDSEVYEVQEDSKRSKLDTNRIW